MSECQHRNQFSSPAACLLQFVPSLSLKALILDIPELDWKGFFLSFRQQILSNVHLVSNAHLKSSAEYSSYLSVWVERPPLAAAPFYRPLWTLLDGVLHKAGFHWVHLEK